MTDRAYCEWCGLTRPCPCEEAAALRIELAAAQAELVTLAEQLTNRRVERTLVQRAGFGWVYGLDLVTNAERRRETKEALTKHTRRAEFFTLAASFPDDGGPMAGGNPREKE